MLCRNFNLYEDDKIMKSVNMKHIQYVRSDVNDLANKIQLIADRLSALESSISKKK
jgi:tetrahydromethanopterin S-methyltransferase subunit F